MEESVKNRVILILGILTIIFFMGTLGSCNSIGRLKTIRDKEMALRLDSEEKMNKLMQDEAAMEEKLNKATQELEEEKVANQSNRKALMQEQLINQSLKEELEKISRLKEKLEENLKDALVTEKSSKSR